jgi:hypothetical protein
MGFKVPILKHFIPVGFQRQFSHSAYQKLYYFKHWFFYFWNIKIAKKIYILLLAFYMFTSSSCSKELSNSFNTSNSKSYSIIFNNLQGGLQSIPRVFDQLWFKKMNTYELPNDISWGF